MLILRNYARFSPPSRRFTAAGKYVVILCLNLCSGKRHVSCASLWYTVTALPLFFTVTTCTGSASSRTGGEKPKAEKKKKEKKKKDKPEEKKDKKGKKRSRSPPRWDVLRKRFREKRSFETPV